MRIVYQSIYIELPYPVVQIIDVKKQEGLNQHACLQITAVIEDEKAEEYVFQMVEGQKIKAGFDNENNSVFFAGYIEAVSVFYDRGQAMLSLIASSFTKKWDIVKRKRSFQDLDLTYEAIINQVLSGFEKASWISKAETTKKIGGLILQYEETDWEFLCRLASHFNTFLMVDPSNERGQVFFGLPEINRGNIVEGNDYTISQDIQRYQSYTQNTLQEFMIQDNLGWNVSGRTSYQLGEQVYWKQVACQVTGLSMETKESEIWYIHHLERTAGVKTQRYGNQKISGLSLPATIKERKGNCLRVHFLIDDNYTKGNHAYFTFAIETTSWYCLPEEGSLVHIYFQNWDEASAIAIHGMRTTGISGSSKSTGSVSAKGAVSDKSFSTSDGKAMKFTETGISFESDENQASVITLSKDGSLNLNGKNIVISSPDKIEAGKAEVIKGEEKTEVIAKNLELECEAGVAAIGIVELGEEEVNLSTDKGISLNEDGSVWIIAAEELSYMGAEKDPPGIQYSDEQLKAEDRAQKEAHNKEVFEVQERAAKSKFGVGTALAVAGVVIVAAAATVLSGGLAAPAAGALVLGAIGALCGTAQMAEATLDLNKMESGDFSQSYNAIRDGVFQGNQALYNTVMYGSIMIGASLLLAPLAAELSFADKLIFQAGSNALLSTSSDLLIDITDGYIDQSWQHYMDNFNKSAAIAAIGFSISGGLVYATQNIAVVNQVLTKAGAFAPALIIGGETAVDVGVDYLSSKMYNTEFDLGKSVITNLATNIVFSIDPVDMATGAFCLETTDLTLANMTKSQFRIQRFYNSRLSCKGIMGKGWRLNLESRLFLHDEEQAIDVLCFDGHMEQFFLQEENYRNMRQGDERYQLRKLPEEGFVMTDIPGDQKYYYDQMGRLTAIKGRGQCSTEIHYQEAHMSQVVTASGYVIDFIYEEDRLVEVREESGRTIQYKYENDYLTAVCHVDEGITTYQYEENHHISQVIDQNGHAYVRNEYDEKGRVAAQYYLDGSKSTIRYDPKKRENIVFIEALGRTERYRYNEQCLITHSFFDDGTIEETGYDEWTNKIYEKDRNGNIIRRDFSVFGNIVREELPSGQIWENEYDTEQHLIARTANTGEEFRYRYNPDGFLVEERTKVREGIWKRSQYERDSYGRILKKTDSRGNEISYTYDKNGGHLLPEPSQVTDAVGQTTIFEYDQAGRKVSTTTEYGTVEFCYNKQNYMIYVRDGKENETRRAYDKMGNMTALFPPNQGVGGHAWMYQYDFFDRLTETRDPLGNVWKQERDLAGNIIRKIHPCGYAKDGEAGYGTRYEYDSDSRRIRTIYPDESVERCFYDGNGNLIKKVRPESYDAQIDDGKGICYQYDGMNRLIRIIDEEGVAQKTLTYDLAGNLTEETDAMGYTTSHHYDLLGNRIATWKPIESTEEEVWYSVNLFEYDTESNLIREKRGRDKVHYGDYPLRYHELYFTYDKLNRLTGVKDRHGAKTVYQYNCLNQKVYESFQISEAVKRMISYEYDSAGNLVKKKEGIEERFLKAKGKEKTILAVTQYEYDPNGNCVRMITPKGYRKDWYYDALDRVIREEEQDKQGGIHRIYGYKYDPAGNLSERVDQSLKDRVYSRRYQYDQKDRLTHFVDENGGVSRFIYDKNDRILKVVRPEQYQADCDNGAGTEFAYNGQDQVVSVTTPDKRILHQYQYDLSGNLHSVWTGETEYTEYTYNAEGKTVGVYTGKGQAEKREAAQSFQYDAQGNITGVRDGNENLTQFVLDDWGRITEVYTPDGGIERYAYDYAGNIISTTDANGGTITYKYNSFGQVYERVDQEGNSEYFYYDEEGRPDLCIDRNDNHITTHYNMDNHLVYRRAEDGNGRYAVTNQYHYYPNGRLKESAGDGITYQYDYTATGLLSRKSSAGRSLLSYDYDKNGNVIELTDVTGIATRYTYDVLNRVREVRDSQNHTFLAAYQYTPEGRIRSLAYGNGVKTEYQYQDDGLMEHLVTVGSDGKVLLNYAYAYDGNGNCTKKSGDVYQNAYGYDVMNRLSEATYHGDTEQFTYDLAGNRLTRKTQTGEERYEYNCKNQLTGLETESDHMVYLYDKQGNLVSEQGKDVSRTYAYDPLNRQNSVTAEKGAASYRYDGEGLRYETEEAGKVIRFVFDRGELAAEESGLEQKRYCRGHHVVSLQNAREDSLHYFVCDEMGSTIYLLDQEQEIRKSYHYDPFGSIIETSGSIENRITYTGQMYDGISGQYYLRARFYNPKIGRFMQEDAYRGDGLNLYAYCQNNPITYYDPSGYMGLCPAGKSNPQAEQTEGSGQEISVGKFPENPDDLLPEIPRDKVTKSNGGTSQKIPTSDNVRIRAETHPLEPGEIYNPRHHGQHYHVEYKIDPSKSWNNKNNVQKVYPPGYTRGSGTGFLPGEDFPH